MYFIFLLFLFIFIRVIEVFFFIKKVHKICAQYDWKYVEKHEEKLLIIMEKDYYINNEWSAYNFLYLKGPNPLCFFFSFKPLKLENQYDEYALKKLKDYEII